MTQQRDVIVVGGGAAGIIASSKAARLGKSVLLLEKNARLGMKILISGGGKCNLTHSGSMEDIRSKFRVNEGRFLKPSFFKFTNNDFLDILHRSGMATYTRPDGRIFPVEPADAKTVTQCLTLHVQQSGVKVRYNCAVEGLVSEGNKIIGVKVEGEIIPAGAIIVAVGGSSYPATGTTGDGWRWVKDLGHSVVPVRAALAPISIIDAKPEWTGLALRDIVLKGRDGVKGKEFVRWRGDALYTHKGVSGPTVLAISRDVAERLSVTGGQSAPFIEADLAPDIAFETLRERLRSEATASPRRTVATLIEPLAPARIVSSIILQSGVDSGQRCSQLSAKVLTKLVSLVKEWPIGTVAYVPLERGEVVAGGVSLDEVDPQTMQSRIISRLYLCGEVLDISGPVGGYNLQAAWSTGYVAGSHSAGS
jgi:predicted Rossmann fold flavoprotein